MYVNLKYPCLVLHQPHRDQEKVTSVGRKPEWPAHVVSLFLSCTNRMKDSFWLMRAIA